MGKFEKSKRPAAASGRPASAGKAAPSGKHRKKPSRVPAIVGVLVGVIVLAGGIIGCTLLKNNRDPAIDPSLKDGMIASNVYVAGINIGDMTKEDALAAIRNVTFDADMDVNFYSSVDTFQLYSCAENTEEKEVDIFGNVIEQATDEQVELEVEFDEQGNPIEVEVVTEAPTEEVTEVEIPANCLLDENGAPVLSTNGDYYLLSNVLHINSEDAQLSLDAEKAIEIAYAVGRSNDGIPEDRLDIDVSECLTINEEYLSKLISDNAEASRIVGAQTQDLGVKDADYVDVEGNPGHGECVSIQLGSMDRSVDAEELTAEIIKAYTTQELPENGVFSMNYCYQESVPAPIDLDELFNKYCTPAVNAVCDPNTYKITPGSNGRGFSKSHAIHLIEEAGAGAVVNFPMMDLAPQFTEEDLASQLFQDVLGSYDSKHVYNPTRTNNLKLACAAIDGTILKPGDIFSYNDTVGERTKAKGYGAAPVYVGGRTEDQLGGGVCQVASTIYYCTLMAELQVVERYGHAYAPTYVPYGMDATVYWKSLDYRFKNNTPYPIRIEASVSNGYVHIKLVGTETRDYKVSLSYTVTESDPFEVVEVEKTAEELAAEGLKDGGVIQTGYTGYKVVTYRHHLDNNNKKIFTEIVNNTTYKRRDKQVAVLKGGATEPSTEPTTPPTQPTEPPTQPTQPTQPTDPPTQPTQPTQPPTEPTEPIIPAEPAEPGNGG